MKRRGKEELREKENQSGQIAELCTGVWGSGQGLCLRVAQQSGALGPRMEEEQAQLGLLWGPGQREDWHSLAYFGAQA